MVEEFEQDTLDFPIGAGLSIETLRGDGVDFVDEDDGRGVLASHAEDVADHAGAFTEIFLDELGPDHADEIGRGRVGDGLDKHRLAGTGGAVEENTAGRVDADLLVEVEMGERELDGLADFLLLHVETTNVGVGHVGLFVGAEHGDGGVSFGGEDVDEGIGVAVEGDRGGGLELLAVEGGQDADDVVAAGGGLNDASAGNGLLVGLVEGRG